MDKLEQCGTIGLGGRSWLEATFPATEGVLYAVGESEASSDATQSSFADFVLARQAQLARLGWALTGDRGLGEDLAQAALQRIWPHWARVSESGDPLAYTQRTMINLWSSWRRRRRWQAERLSDSPPETPCGDGTSQVDERDALDAWLAVLPARQRAVVVLRFLLDLDVNETAARLSCSPGTVKSQTAKAFRKLRAAWVAPDRAQGTGAINER